MAPLHAPPELAETTRAPRGYAPPRFHLVPQAFALIDVACIVTLSIMCGVVYSAAKIGHVGDVSHYFGFGIAVAVLFSIWAHKRGLYSKSLQQQVRFQIQAVTHAWTMVFLFLVMVGLVLKVSDVVPQGTVLLIFLTGLGGMAILRWGAERVLVYLTRSGALASRQTISWRGLVKRDRSPISARIVTAAIRSMPRIAISAGTIGAKDQSASTSRIACSRRSTRSPACRPACSSS